MFDKIKSFLNGAAGPVSGSSDGPDEQHLAEAALMFHVIAADGRIRSDEVERMKSVLASQYQLDGREMEMLLAAAEEAEREAVDLYRFTSLLNQRYDRQERIAMIERLWEMVFADGELHEFEDNVVWRVAQLLHVEAPDRIAMKQRVRDRDGVMPDGDDD